MGISPCIWYEAWKYFLPFLMPVIDPYLNPSRDSSQLLTSSS
jgi:hypothetical protein